MKHSNKFSFLPLILVLSLLVACTKSDGDRHPLSDDKTKPGVVTNVQVKNINGAAVLTYTLPSSDNFLYVLADYKINDTRSRQTKSSYYIDTVLVDGFARSQDYEVKLYSVSRANIMSEPVIVHVHPDTPWYQLIKRSAKILPDFGGLNVTALNPTRKAVSVSLVVTDPDLNKLQIQDQHYGNEDSINYSVRGFQSQPRQFGYFVTDQFGNISDTTFITLTPLFESLLDKSKFFKYPLPSDSQIGYGWETLYLWDGKTDGSSNGWHTTGGSIPIQCTFGFGQTAKLSHFILWERPDGSIYGYGEPKDFTLWGSNKDAPGDAVMQLNAPQGTVIGDWTSLGTFHFPDPPSGLLPGSTNAADEAFVEAGVNFNVSINNPAIKFIRFTVNSTWGGVDYAHMMELSFYGN